MAYLQSDLQAGLNSITHGQAGNIIAVTDLMNRSARLVFGNVDLRAAKRKTQITPGVYGDVNSYFCPIDMKSECIIDVERQVSQFGLGGQFPRREEFELTTAEEFSRKKHHHRALLAFDDHDGLRSILISTRLNTKYAIIDVLTSFNDNGTWSAGANISNLRQDFSNFLYANSALAFDTSANFSTVTITNSTLTVVNLSTFTANEIFLYVYCPVTTGLTGFTLTWGTGASNYWSQAVTTTHENTSFVLGWNTLRFEWPATATGTPNSTLVNYATITINATGTIAAAVGWRFTYLVARIGDINNLRYYTKYPWIDGSTGLYKENSTQATDILVADTDEFDLIVQKSGVPASQELRFSEEEKKGIHDMYIEMETNYKARYPLERKIIMNTYHEFSSLDGDYDSWNRNWAPGSTSN